MAPAFIDSLPPARLKPYRDYWARMSGGIPADLTSLAALYLWQVSMSAAWYEVLCHTEVIVRNALDTQLRAFVLMSISEDLVNETLEMSRVPSVLASHPGHNRTRPSAR